MKISFFDTSFFANFSTSAYSQFAPSDLDESFLEGLPPSVREQVEIANKVNQDEELDRLFRTDTSIEKNKFILQRLKEEINALEQQISLDSNEKVGLERYDSSFLGPSNHHLCQLISLTWQETILLMLEINLQY